MNFLKKKVQAMIYRNPDESKEEQELRRIQESF
jgi:hypothetical protein